MTVPIRIIMADDHELVRDGFAGMFLNHPSIELVDLASNGKLLISLVTKHQPDVVITDIQMPEMGGIEATRIIHSRFPNIAVIAMSMHGTDYHIMEMLEAGAIGFIGKNSAKQVIYDAIQAAYSGEHFYCRSTSEKLNALITSGRFDQKNQVPLDFTPIQLRIIRCMCMDLDIKEIAENLSISPVSVKKNRMEIMDRMSVNSVAGVVMWAVRNGVYRG